MFNKNETTKYQTSLNTIITIKNQQNTENEYTLIAYDSTNGIELGYLSYILWNGTIFFPNLNVDSKFRNLRVGTTLITELEIIALENNINSISSYVNLSSKTAFDLTASLKRKNFYENLGFSFKVIPNSNNLFEISKSSNKFLTTGKQLDIKKISQTTNIK